VLAPHHSTLSFPELVVPMAASMMLISGPFFFNKPISYLERGSISSVMTGSGTPGSSRWLPCLKVWK